MNSLIPGVILFTVLILLLAMIVMRVKAWLLPSRPVKLTINQQPPVSVKSGKKLLEILNELDIPVPSGCAGVGTCGLCKVMVVDGGGQILTTEASRLSKAERQNNIRLACQVPVRNNLSIAIPQQILHAEKWLATVKSVKSLSPLVREFVIDMPAGESLNFKSGAYIQITSPAYSLLFSDCSIDSDERRVWDSLGVSTLKAKAKEPTTRAYSLANKPGENQSAVLLIRLALPPPAQLHNLPPGIVSSWLFSLNPGDKIEISGPYGDFGLHENEREMVLIGGGVGMAPLRSLIHHELTSTRQRRLSFFYGARSQADLLYADEFNQLANEQSRFDWVIALSEPVADSDWDGPVGFVHTIFKQQFLDSHAHPERCDYYLCGPPLMQRAVMAVLDDAGVDMSNVYADIFGE